MRCVSYSLIHGGVVQGTVYIPECVVLHSSYRYLIQLVVVASAHVQKCSRPVVRTGTNLLLVIYVTLQPQLLCWSGLCTHCRRLASRSCEYALDEIYNVLNNICRGNARKLIIVECYTDCIGALQ